MILSQTAAFVVTLALEAPAAFLLARLVGADRRLSAAAATLGSALTHPFVWFGVMSLTPRIGGWATPLAEAGAILAETCVYRAFASPRWSAALVLSVVVNGLSWGLGALLYALG